MEGADRRGCIISWNVYVIPATITAGREETPDSLRWVPVGKNFLFLCDESTYLVFMNPYYAWCMYYFQDYRLRRG